VIMKLLGKAGSLLSGKILLEKKSVLRAKRAGEQQKQALRRLLTAMEEAGLGRVETLPGRYPIIYFHKKRPEDLEEPNKEALQRFGISFAEYERKFFLRNDESSQHSTDFARHQRPAVQEPNPEV